MVPTFFSVGKTPTLWVFSQVPPSVSIHIHKRYIKHCITLKLLVSPSPSSFNFTHSLIHYIKNSALNCSEEGSHQFSLSSSLSSFSFSPVLIGLDHHDSLAEWLWLFFNGSLCLYAGLLPRPMTLRADRRVRLWHTLPPCEHFLLPFSES